MPNRLSDWAIRVKRELYALLLAARDPRVPWYVKALVLATIAYAASPVDLIPDVIPVFGLLDDLLIVPAAIWLILRLMPADVLADARQQALSHDEARRRGTLKRHPLRWLGLAVMLLLWVAAALLVWWLIARLW